MKKMQQALGKKLEQMKEQWARPTRRGWQAKPGGMSKELAQMAAQQAALRKMAQKAKQLNEDGSGKGNQMGDIAKEMEEIERDLVNRQVDQATLSVNKTSSHGFSRLKTPNAFGAKKRSAPPKQATTR